MKNFMNYRMWYIDNWIQIHEKVNELINMMDVSLLITNTFMEKFMNSWIWYMSFYLNFVGYDGGSEYSQTWNQETKRDAEF